MHGKQEWYFGNGIFDSIRDMVIHGLQWRALSSDDFPDMPQFLDLALWHGEQGYKSRNTQTFPPDVFGRRAACKSLRYSRCATVRKLLLKKYRWKDLLGRQVIIPPLNCAGHTERSPTAPLRISRHCFAFNTALLDECFYIGI
jgi:hypothetical protein